MQKISIIIPLYNEAKNIPELFVRLGTILEKIDYEHEIIAVNDGSQDESWTVLKQLAQSNHYIKLINFGINQGQTAALSAGIDSALGDIVVAIDADLENHPEDIPAMLVKINEGYDVVSGWRKDRWNDHRFKRKLPSLIANKCICLLSGVFLHDVGCTLKAYRKEIIQGIKLYGEMHRFIPAIAAWKHARIAEIPVRYTPRKHGMSNYTTSRVIRVVLDLVLLKFLVTYMNRPMHFFGGAGLVSGISGVFSGLLAVYFKFSTAHQKDFVETPLPVITAMFLLVGVMFILMGILAEMIMRTYYESQGKQSYTIKEKINFDV